MFGDGCAPISKVRSEDKDSPRDSEPRMSSTNSSDLAVVFVVGAGVP
jgi:hypothetical protein